MDNFVFSGFGEVQDFVRGGPIHAGAIPISGNDYIAMVSEPDQMTGHGAFQIVPVGFAVKYPHFKIFAKERCPYCKMLRPKVERMISVFDQMKLDIPVYEIDADKENVGNEILESVSDVIGYPFLRYYSKNGLTAAYEHGDGNDESVEEFIEGVSKLMALVDRDANFRERVDKMITANDKIAASVGRSTTVKPEKN